MRVFASTALVLVAGACLAGGAVAFKVVHPKAAVRLKECSRDDRSAVFYARMRGTPETRTMAMRFTLLERRGGARFERVRAPGLGRWRKSKLDVSTFGYRQRVRGLVEGSAYRMLVRFRWYNDDGELIRRTRRRSRLCRQFDAPPNLRARLAGAEPTGVAGVVRYAVRVRNAGPGDAAYVPLRLTVDGDEVNTVVLPRLPSGESRLVRFRGPACEREAVTEADPSNVLRETNEHDNRDVSPCGELSE